MASKVTIGGTNYDVKGGKTTIGGTGYSITKGKTTISGTGYDIDFVTPINGLKAVQLSRSTEWRKLVYSNGLIGIFGALESGKSIYASTSSDKGNTWTTSANTDFTYSNDFCVIPYNNKFIKVGAYHSYESSDCVNWSLISNSNARFGGNYKPHAVYGDGNYGIISVDTQSDPYKVYFSYSINPSSSWTNTIVETDTNGGSENCLAYGNNTFVFGNLGNTTVYQIGYCKSPYSEAIFRDLPNKIKAAPVYCGNEWLLIDVSGNNRGWIRLKDVANDTITSFSPPINIWSMHSIAYGGGKIMLSYMDASKNEKIAYSMDKGVTWTNLAVPSGANFTAANDIIYVDDVFILAGYGTDNKTNYVLVTY